VNDKKTQEVCAEMADTIDTMMSALASKGFTRPESVQLIAGMLVSTHVYAPFVGVAGAQSESMH